MVNSKSTIAVLIIDDDEDIRRIIKRQLQRTAYTVFEAGNRPEAFAILREQNISAVVCDIKMKDTDGFEITQQIKEQFPLLPVIILTGFIGEEYSDKAKELGCFAFLIKPVKREKLIQVLKRALSKSK
ncbi:MAG: response regulator [Spirochaetales bacterium]|nr:response regulator [Spirochaetales bacterium]